MAVKGYAQVKWYGQEVLKELAEMTEVEERAAAERIHKKVKKYVPVGGVKRSVSRGGKYKGKTWTSRYPGRLKRSVKIRPGKYGGWIVKAGDRNAYYAVFVEYGTVFTFNQKFGRKGEKYMRRAVNTESRRFHYHLKKRLGA